MKASIKVLHESDLRTSKNGKKYRKMLVLIKIGKNEYIETYYIYQ